MSFYISYTKTIKSRKAPHIFFFKDNDLYLFFGKAESKIAEYNNDDNPLIVALNYIESNGINNSEILLPSFGEDFLDDACDSISKYLLENDDSVGILTNNYNFREDYSWILNKYGITYSIPHEKPTLGIPQGVEKPKSKKKPKFITTGIEISSQASFKSCAPKRPELEDKIESGLIMDEPFNVKFVKMLNESGKSNVEVYTKGGITRQVFSNILSKKDFIPKKDTIICLIIGMELNYIDGINLLASAGYTLSKSIVSDVVIMKHLKRGVHDLEIINDELDERGCSLLGWKPRAN